MKNRWLTSVRWLFLIFTLALNPALILLGMAQTPGPAAVARVPRNALIIANSRYINKTDFIGLADPTEMLSQLAAVLQAAGFDVELHSELNKVDLEETIARFGDPQKSGGVRLFYYSGHGLQLNNVNYLVPIDGKAQSVNEITKGMVSVQKVFDAVSGSAPNIVILDACRTNPMGPTATNPLAWLRPGLVDMPSVPSRTIVAFPTSPNTRTPDADSIAPVTPYTRALLNLIPKPGLQIDRLFQQVRASFVTALEDRVPSTNLTLREPFYFHQPAFIEARFEGSVDDDAAIILNDEVVMTAQSSEGKALRIPLESGENSLKILVYNEQNFGGGTEAFHARKPNGWSYKVAFSLDGSLLREFSGIESVPRKNGPHHNGKFFLAARALIVVKSEKDISFQKVDEDYWKTQK